MKEYSAQRESDWIDQREKVMNKTVHADHINAKIVQDFYEDLLRREETCCHLDSSEGPPVQTGAKNRQGLK